MLVLDLLGGPAAERDDCLERRNAVTGRTYVWEQERFEPVSREILCHLSLRDDTQVRCRCKIASSAAQGRRIIVAASAYRQLCDAVLRAWTMSCSSTHEEPMVMPW